MAAKNYNTGWMSERKNCKHKIQTKLWLQISSTNFQKFFKEWRLRMTIIWRNPMSKQRWHCKVSDTLRPTRFTTSAPSSTCQLWSTLHYYQQMKWLKMPGLFFILLNFSRGNQRTPPLLIAYLIQANSGKVKLWWHLQEIFLKTQGTLTNKMKTVCTRQLKISMSETTVLNLFWRKLTGTLGRSTSQAILRRLITDFKVKILLELITALSHKCPLLTTIMA